MTDPPAPSGSARLWPFVVFLLPTFLLTLYALAVLSEMVAHWRDTPVAVFGTVALVAFTVACELYCFRVARQSALRRSQAALVGIAGLALVLTAFWSLWTVAFAVN